MSQHVEMALSAEAIIALLTLFTALGSLALIIMGILLDLRQRPRSSSGDHAHRTFMHLFLKPDRTAEQWV